MSDSDDEDCHVDEVNFVKPKPSFVEMRLSNLSEVKDAVTVESNRPESIAASSDRSSKRTVKQKRKLRKADTNIVSVQFNRLLESTEMHAGDVIKCNECGVIASHLSKIKQAEPQQQSDADNESGEQLPQSLWECEFCKHANATDIEQTDLPKQEDVTYLVAPAPAVHGADMTGVDNSIVIFVIDISGSMSTTTLINGTFQMPNALNKQQRMTENFGGARMIRQHNQTYVTRLQGVQMAVDSNLEKLMKEHPTRRAVLLTFNYELTYYGDGSKEPLVIRGDKLNSKEELIREAEQENNHELKPIIETKKKLVDRIYDLEEGGQTALGPAVMFALYIASKRQGSKIVLCTDGLANRGIGSLEVANDETSDEIEKERSIEEGNQFYGQITDLARDKGISISVITIKGTTCLLPIIGQMADGSGGQVTVVDLMNIRDEFATILEQQVIASNVQATLIVHRGLYIRNPENNEEKLNKSERDIGNVTKETEITFEFGVRNKQELKALHGIDFNQLKQFPFQLQVLYTAADGTKALRVLTQLKEATENREIAEQNAVRSVIAENHIRSTAHNMMNIDDDDDDMDYRGKTRYASNVFQKQQQKYITNLNKRVKDGNADEFNTGRWDKASKELHSHVKQAKSHKRMNNRGRQEHEYTGAKVPIVSTSRDGDTSTTAFSSASMVSSKQSEAPSKPRSYGFTAKNARVFSDIGSSKMYQYKQMNTNFLRSSSPPSGLRNESEEEKPQKKKTNIQEEEDEDDDEDEWEERKKDAKRK
ncbi:unnamed protein product [Didymodactylos carnosus]|uniref:VWFA domain-containing protein n=1 Tax=Didymodactylos carnosus TaxID=1234261 RepID=A0A814IPW7_9BILA|nr:unnamed protein product [Didymodactylos carnosus]CAF3798357.1 unnamed protein product [Didymodactylos carnosus]